MRRPARLLLILACMPIACSGGKDAGTIGPKGVVELNKPHSNFLRDEIPADQLDSVISAHYAGLGGMEQYKYARAVASFREVHERAPGWIPGSINLSIALLNQAGETLEAERTSGRVDTPTKESAGTASSALDQGLEILKEVLERDPDNLNAHFCRGLILQQDPERIALAHAEFVRVARLDPRDAHAWFRAGMTMETSIQTAKERIKFFEKAIECNPYLAPALYNLAFAYRLDGQAEKQAELLAAWNKLKSDQPPDVLAPGPADPADTVYGEMGRYATIIDPFPTRGKSEGQGISPRFGAATSILTTLAKGERWAHDSDFTGKLAVIGRARARFGAAVATFDADGDGMTDLYLAASVVGPDGVRDALLLNRGEGRFEDVTLAYGLPGDRASLGVAAADFDADRHIDLFLTGPNDNRLFRNLGSERFENVSQALKSAGPPSVALTARWLDLDQDGDLDLYVVNYCKHADREIAFTDQTPSGARNSVFRNDGRPVSDGRTPIQALAPIAVAWPNSPSRGGLTVAFTTWPNAEALKGGEAPHTGIAALDLDDDRDLDLVLAADGAAPTALLNDRVGRFHAVALKNLASKEPGSGLLALDLDKDGLTDLVSVSARGSVIAWRNATDRDRGSKDALSFEAWALDARNWRSAQAADLDLDGWHDLVGLPSGTDAAAPAWSRNEGTRFSTRSVALGMTPPGLIGLTYADVTGDPLPDLILMQPGEPPKIARNQGNGHHWMALELGGRWRVKPELMRTNPHAIGARLVVEGQGVHVPYELTTQDSGLAQSVGPIVVGLGTAPGAMLIHARWPDGVLQCELNPKADQKQSLTENNRKTGSCPVLFTWNGERFVCLGDFLGGGGIGYLVAPGAYGTPDRDEAVAIAPDRLREVGGVYKLSVTEPMDEVAYLDRLVLDVIDRPPGVSTTPDERFAPQGTRPTGEIVAWKKTIEPVRATDLAGQDATNLLRAWDRRTVDGFRLMRGWTGYAEEHGIVLDFGDRLRKFGPTDSLVLCLAGWVEYPYSQTNYAAATAGVVLMPPAIERRRADGSWETIEPHAGYPAGMPRMTTLDLTGKLTGERCMIRLRTNMECYWDQAFVAVRDRNSGVKVTHAPLSRAALGFRGYTREVSPDGRLPLLYDYNYVDPAPLARMAGKLTRLGDVAALLKYDDDQFCLLGPGDEVRLEFDAQQSPPLPKGWTRSYVVRAVGYCKDADPFTATSDAIGPLPWKAMPKGFPLSRDADRPLDDSYRAYLRAYQTRPAGER